MFTIATITIAGDVLVESHEDKPESLLPILYRLIDCQMVECRDLVGAGMTAWFDEEGLYSDHNEVNLLATAICEAHRQSNGRIGFVGNAVFTGLPDREGETTGLDEGQIRYIQQAAADMSITISTLRAEYSTPE